MRLAQLLIVLFIGLLFEAAGVIFLSKGLKQLSGPESVTFSEAGRFLAGVMTSRLLWTGIAFEAIFFVSLLYLMSRGSVSWVWPMTSLGFVLTTLAAKIFLHEHVPPLRWAGVVLIMAGAALITWTEQGPKTGLNDPSSTESPRVQDRNEHPG